uniref:Piwi domain-containing protein n=1 Tax=Panagrolaimus davidi TaxID=227884 RepID=A0A914QIF5_9BILA
MSRQFVIALKARGVNWELGSDPALVTKLQNRDLLKSLMQNTLFFGIDLSHPLGQANMSKGDFGYQAPQKTIVDAALLEAKFDAAINAYYRNSGRYPSWIVVYRSGLSEAEVQKVQDEEVPVLKATIDKFKARSTEFNFSGVKLTVIMANTKSNFRLFKDEIDTRDKAPMQNVPSGTCVSEKIVSPVYHVLEGADAYPLDQIQYVTYCLCFSHGIVGSPTKLPGPLVSAADLSKRARNNFRQHKLNGNDDTGSVTSDDSARYRQSQGDIVTEEEKKQLDSKEEAHYDELNNILKAAIEEGRFWA